MFAPIKENQTIDQFRLANHGEPHRIQATLVLYGIMRRTRLCVDFKSKDLGSFEV